MVLKCEGANSPADRGWQGRGAGQGGRAPLRMDRPPGALKPGSRQDASGDCS